MAFRPARRGREGERGLNYNQSGEEMSKICEKEAPSVVTAGAQGEAAASSYLQSRGNHKYCHHILRREKV